MLGFVFKRCGAAMLLLPLVLLVIGLLVALIVPFIPQQAPGHAARERSALEKQNNDAAVR